MINKKKSEQKIIAVTNNMANANRISFLQLAELVLVAGSMLVMQSCIKDEFTRPVRISLSVIITEQNKTSNTLSFESGEIIINEIQFDGQREAGGDYFFHSESDKEFGPHDFYPQSANQLELAHFDFPQGIYTSMKWKFALSDGLERLGQDDDDEVTPGLILEGNYIDLSGVNQRLRIEIDPFESFDCLSLTSEGDKNINIISGKAYNAVLYFDPYFVFRAISSESLEEADYSDDDNSPVLLISSDSNEELYEIILYRLQQSVRIVVS